jgi:hypothetical protein
MGRENPEPVTRPAPPIEATLGWLGIAFATLYLASVYVKTPILRPGLTVGDLIDAVTPFVLVFLYARVVRALRTGSPGHRLDSLRILHFGRMLLAAGGLALVLGHGMHVAANSIHDAITRTRLSDPFGLVNWWDERVSHYVIDSSKVVICAALTLLDPRSHAYSEGAAQGESRVALLVTGAVCYGFIYFAAGVEGRTVPLLLPFSATYLVWAFTRGRPWSPVRRFFGVGAAVSILLFAIWGVSHGGFPEFSAVGMIPHGGP